MQWNIVLLVIKVWHTDRLLCTKWNMASVQWSHFGLTTTIWITSGKSAYKINIPTFWVCQSLVQFPFKPSWEEVCLVWKSWIIWSNTACCKATDQALVKWRIFNCIQLQLKIHNRKDIRTKNIASLMILEKSHFVGGHNQAIKWRSTQH